MLGARHAHIAGQELAPLLLFKPAGFSHFAAYDGTEAIELSRKHLIACVLISRTHEELVEDGS
jgi:hypothetical protein